MDPITVSIDVPASVEEVWARLADLASHQHWMGDVGDMSFEGDQRQGVGTVLIVETVVGPLRVTDRMVVSRWEPPRGMTVEHEGRIKGRGEFILTPIGGATRFIWTEELVFPWQLGGALTALAARPILASIWRRNLRRFRDLFG